MQTRYRVLSFAAAIVVLAAITTRSNAEVSELNVAQQYGVSFLPLMWMEHNKLIEKHAKAQGLGDIKVNWAKLAGPAAMNDALLSGSLHFSSVGAPSLITLRGKT